MITGSSCLLEGEDGAWLEWFMLSYLQIFLQISLQILKLIVRRKILAYKARFEIKETRIGKKHMCKKKLFLRVMRLPDNERDNLYEKKKENRAAVVCWRSQCLLERSMWDRWPSATLRNWKKLQDFSRVACHRGAELRFLCYLVHGMISALDLAIGKLYSAFLAIVSPCLFKKH